MAASINIRVRQKRYDTRSVLDKVVLDIEAGEIVSLIGPSGCGKSTLLRIVAGLDEKYAGTVLVDRQPTTETPIGAVGVVFQEPRLLPWLNVADNIAFAAGGRGAHDAEVHKLLAEVGLAGYGDVLPKQLSGGMAQRVAIARALYTQPRALLLDEPFSAVDAFTRMRLQDMLLDIAQRRGTTMLVVTHDLDEAVYLSDRVVTMGGSPGRVLADIAIPLSRPRDRLDKMLGDLKADVLKVLDAAHAI